MTTEPHLKRKNMLAGVYGASASTGLILASLVFLALYPAVPEDDSGIQSIAIAAGFLPLVWGVLFIYFLCLSFKKLNPLRFVFNVQFIWTFSLSIFMGYAAVNHEGWQEGIVVAGVWFLLLSVFLSIGSWLSTIPK